MAERKEIPRYPGYFISQDGRVSGALPPTRAIVHIPEVEAGVVQLTLPNGEVRLELVSFLVELAFNPESYTAKFDVVPADPRFETEADPQLALNLERDEEAE